ncbi:MAG: MAPEG family protein [Pseudomonadota bacterium]
MTFWILGALGLFFVQTALPPLFRFFLRSDPQLTEALGPRDTPVELGIYGKRAERALHNMIEGMLVFLPLALLGQSIEAAVFGAQIFVLARLAYVPAYLSGVPVLRSAIWVIGIAGLVQMGLAVAG